MVNCIETFLISFTGPQAFIILLVAIILIVGVVFYRKNYIQQIGVAQYMDEECGVYNKDGLVCYLKGHKKKLTAPLLLAVEISNLSTLYNSNIADKKQLMVNVADCLLEGMAPIETLGRCTSSIFIMVLEGKDKDEAKKLTQVIEERLLGLRIPSYGSYNFLLRYGINDVVDLKEPEVTVQRTISLFDFSNSRDGNIYYYADTVKAAMAKYAEINAAKDAALEAHQFQAYIQPKVYLKTGKVVGGEILCRWLNSQGDIVYYPNEFIPIFESNGFIKKVDAEMFEQACQLVQNLTSRGYSDIVVSVNFSKVNFESKTFFEEIMDILSKYNARPQNIEIEITETAIMMSPTYINQCIMKLRNLGFHLSMDDFGKEYSSLGSLVNSPFDTIKMDAVFFQNNLAIEKEKVIAKKVLQMLRDLKLHIVCEGVESERALEQIALINNDVEIQGFVYSRPVTLAQFESTLQTVFPHDYKTSDPEEDEETQEPAKATAAPKKQREITNEELDDLELIKMQLLSMKKELDEEKAKKAQAEKQERLKKLKDELLAMQKEEEEDPYEAELKALQAEIAEMKAKKKAAPTPIAKPEPEAEPEIEEIEAIGADDLDIQSATPEEAIADDSEELAIEDAPQEEELTLEESEEALDESADDASEEETPAEESVEEETPTEEPVEASEEEALAEEPIQEEAPEEEPAKEEAPAEEPKKASSVKDPKVAEAIRKRRELLAKKKAEKEASE